MGYYYKLLDLIKGKYTTHETLEEVHHYITHSVKDMQYDYKVTDKLIRTSHPNYEFHYVIVEDDSEFREFLYFFDSIEEELDSREDVKGYLDKLYHAYNTISSERSEIKDLKTKLSILEAGLKESERNVEFWKTRCEKAEELIQKIRDFAFPF